MIEKVRMNRWAKTAVAVSSATLCVGLAVTYLGLDPEVAAAPQAPTTSPPAPPAPVQTTPTPSEPTETEPVADDPEFTRTMYASAPVTGFDSFLDACKGPVAIDMGEGLPTLVAEHDYCGGSAWIPEVEIGDTVELKGDGIQAGVYEASARKNAPRYVSTTDDLPPGEIVLQTCISASEMVFVALEKVT